jgi:hypothetical protein
MSRAMVGEHTCLNLLKISCNSALSSTYAAPESPVLNTFSDQCCLNEAARREDTGKTQE